MMNFLIVALILSNPALVTQETKHEVEIRCESEIIDGIFDAYRNYKTNKVEYCTKTMRDFGFTVSKKSNVVIPENAKIDTLVFSNSELTNHVFVTSVDLGYLKNINGYVIIKSENATWLAERFLKKITETNVQATVDYNELTNEYTVKDNTAFKVFDNRWMVETTSVFSTFYTCTIAVLGDYLDISFEEVVPKKFVILGEESNMQNHHVVGL